MTDAFVLGGVRTPFGRYGGALSHVRTDDLLGQTMVWACERVGVDLGRIEDIAAGCVNVAHEGMGDIARWAALAAGFPDSVPAATVNRFCASSVTCAIQIAHAIRSDELGVGLAGGVESMSRSGWAFMKGDAPFAPRGPIFMLDTMWAGAGGPRRSTPWRSPGPASSPPGSSSTTRTFASTRRPRSWRRCPRSPGPPR